MLFISFEGIDGSGKSTQAELLIERLSESGWNAALFREPGGTELSERIRSLLLDPSLTVGDMAELLLFSSARAQLVEERIRPALAEGTVVVCDRFYDSTTAYQGAGRRVADLGWVNELNRHATRGLEPDRTYLVKLDPELAHRRRMERADGEPVDRMETNDLQFYRRVANAYQRVAEEEPNRILVIDGDDTVESINEFIWADVNRLLARRQGTASSG